MDDQECDEMHRRRKVFESNGGEIVTSNGGETITSKGVSGGSEESQRSEYTNRNTPEMDVRKHMERLRNDFVDHVNDQFEDMMSKMMKDLEIIDKLKSTNVAHLNDTEKAYIDKRKPAGSRGLPEKEFYPRNSVLTDLYEIKHFRTIYNAFIMILIVISLNTVMHDLLYTGSTHFGWKLIKQGFAKFSIVIEIWLVMVAATFAVYGAFNYWAQQRVKLPPKSFRLKVWDYGWLVLFIVYQLVFIAVPAYMTFRTGLPPVSRVIILTEQVRMIMKIHAFVRSVSPRVVARKFHSDDEKLDFPGFSKFLYFMFAPVLIYRDNYPRTKEIRWRFVIWHLFEVMLVTFNMAFLFERHLLPPFEDFGKHPIDVRSFVLTIYGTVFPSFLVFLSGFYCLLHAWMNAAAEVTKFADRLFYKDWWNSTTYGIYFRFWNVVVHDWLYTYIYKDMYEIVTPGRRVISTCAVFFISALFHEYILTIAFSLLLPIMIVQFGIIGFLLAFVIRTGRSWGNVFLWFSLCTGSGIMISLYSMEYFARVNCPKRIEGWMDLVLPRAFNCF